MDCFCGKKRKGERFELEEDEIEGKLFANICLFISMEKHRNYLQRERTQDYLCSHCEWSLQLKIRIHYQQTIYQISITIQQSTIQQ